MSEPYAVLLVDDEALLRQALQIIIGADPRFGRISTVAGAREMDDLLARCSFDLIVLDYDMPDEDGLTAAGRIRERLPGQRTLILTRYAKPGLMRQALHLGVEGFLTKAAAPGNVIDAAVAVIERGRYIDPDIAGAAIAGDCPLTDRELDVLRLAGRGYTARSIASKLFLSPGTVRNYLSSAMLKTGTSRREDAVDRARERHWI